MKTRNLKIKQKHKKINIHKRNNTKTQ